MMNYEKHPCFNTEARHSTGRIHLPVAERCNIRCNFCNRKFDCVNESRPGVTSKVLSPSQALSYLDSVLRKINSIAVVGIAGPGDPFANPEETLETMELIRERYPEKILCLATNGLCLAEYGDRLAKLNISHVTVTVNAVDPALGARIYSWVRFGPKVYRGREGAELLFERQCEGIKMLKSLGITVKVNTVIIPGINDTHGAEIASAMAALGADIQNCIPMMHVEDTPFADLPSPSPECMEALRNEAGKYLKQMSHCAHCRADAAGLLGAPNPVELNRLLADAALIKPTAERPYVAVASMEGLFVNRHLGEASALWIFALEGGRLSLREQRPAPAPGLGDLRWEQLAETLKDCAAVLVSGCGPNPKKILEKRGVPVIAAEGLIGDTAGPLLEGKGIPRGYTASPDRRGTGCDGLGRSEKGEVNREK
ncbi:MAG: radical SAM protein [Spirochaetaceae bacterium]|jgi:nitrogen fixation protein NifB|nr:radical SAM protein [Spirochaetaceae bacterium]